MTDSGVAPLPACFIGVLCKYYVFRINSQYYYSLLLV
nr:MAG TPA: hypothetical protein [Caudoviricetes sp.]